MYRCAVLPRHTGKCGLRDYGTAAWEGGDDSCDHLAQATGSTQNKGCNGSFASPFRESCGKCGAKRIDSQLGLEASPEIYVQRMVEVFREVRRVLRKDGTLWLNLGDSYASASACDRRSIVGNGSPDENCKRPNRLSGTLKEKDLVGIPWRVAFALQADGWWLRSDIIWAKPNPMPESVTDRPTKSHEYLFLLTKSANYFYDAEAIKEPAEKTGTPGHLQGGNGARAGTREGLRGTRWEQSAGRNKRSVWTVATAPYPEAHFATYPPDLIKPCIMAGSRPGDMVLDPFAGSGTTGVVALELGRKAILIELNPKYCELIEQRCNVTMGLALA